MKKGGFFQLVIVFTVILSNSVFAQYSIQHQPPTVLDAAANNQLEFYVPGLTPTDIVDALLFYRNEGDLGYSQMELSYANGVFVATLTDQELLGSSFEYYFQLTLSSQEQDIFYPDNVPAENPIKVDIVRSTSPQKPDEIIQRRQAKDIDYTILSPKPGNGLTPEDAYIAIALFYDASTLPSGSFKLYLDDIDVTAQADTSAYFISYKPKNLSHGSHSITLDFLTEDGPLEVAHWSFDIVRPGQASFKGFDPTMVPTGRVELTARNQVISGDVNNAFTGRSYITGGYKTFRYTLSGFLTSQESARLQPQNRISLSMNLGKWWNFEAGHVYPHLSRFTIAGRRMYGINTSVHLLWENINVQFLYGELNRKITNLYGSIEREEIYADSMQTNPVDTTYTLTFQNSGRGTFSRKITGGRIALGNSKSFQFGIQAMKVEDDSSSIFNITDYSDVHNSPTFLLSGLTIADQQRLAEQPELLRVEGGAPRPKGNIVAGVDMKLAFNNNKVRFETETVASALNNDIYGGPLDSLRAADLGFEVNQSDLDILERISHIIIINENMSVLPFRVTGIGNEDSTETEVFFPTSILGHNSELSLVYPKNTLSVQYRWVGPEFVSLANSTIRKDIAGFTALDRFRLFQNQLYVTLGFESLVDNVTRIKEATTTTNSLRSNVSWFPQNQILPRVSVGFRYRNRDNGVTRFNPWVPENLEGAAVQNLRIEDHDTLTTTTPRLNSTLNLNLSVTQQIPLQQSVHDATFTVSSLTTRDKVFAFGDVINRSFSFSVASRFLQLPLRTQGGVSVNKTESGNGQLSIDIFGMYAGGTYMLMDGRLNINGRLAFTSNTSKTRRLDVVDQHYVEQRDVLMISDPTLDDNYLNDYYELSTDQERSKFNTFVLIAGAEYKLAEQHSLVFSSNFTNVSGRNSLNDRVVQLRYIYRF